VKSDSTVMDSHSSEIKSEITEIKFSVLDLEKNVANMTSKVNDDKIVSKEQEQKLWTNSTNRFLI